MRRDCTNLPDIPSLNIFGFLLKNSDGTFFITYVPNRLSEYIPDSSEYEPDPFYPKWEVTIYPEHYGKFGINNGVIAFTDKRGEGLYITPYDYETEEKLCKRGYSADSELTVPMSNGERMLFEGRWIGWNELKEILRG